MPDPFSTRHGIDPTGTRRRLQALYAIGWGWKPLGERLGTYSQVVYRVAAGKHATVMERTADKVAALYDELSSIRPEGPQANWIRSRARKNGYLPPEAWDDDTIDDPEAVSLLADPSTLTYDQRLKLAVQLVEYGATQRQAAKRCHVADDTIRKAMKGAA